MKKKRSSLYSSTTSLDISSLFPFSSFYVPLFDAIINAGATSVGLDFRLELQTGAQVPTRQMLHILRTDC